MSFHQMEKGKREEDGGGNGGKALASQESSRCAILADALAYCIILGDATRSIGKDLETPFLRRTIEREDEVIPMRHH